MKMKRINYFKKLTIAVALVLITSPYVFGQKSYDLHLKTGVIKLQEKRGVNRTSKVDASSLYEGKYYLIAQFYDLPTASQKKAITEQGIELIEYLPHMAYVLAIPAEVSTTVLFQNGARALLDMSEAYKISPLLQEEELSAFAKRGDDKIALNIIFFENAAADHMYSLLTTKGATVMDFNGFDMFTVETDQANISNLASIPSVCYIEPFVEAESFNDEGIIQHRNNVFQNSFPGGRNYDGKGVGVAVGDETPYDRDHIDFKGRMERSSGNGTSHATHVTGTVVGAGNLNPRGRGQAPSSHVWGYAQFEDIPDLSNTYQLGVRVSNHSLGWTSGNNRYNGQARTGDLSNERYPSIIHVHAAGNSGQQNQGNIGAGPGWGTIGGMYSASKNCITVGNLNDKDELNATSSRGPLNDGRLKPDICGKGTAVFSSYPDNDYRSISGTSMASPGVCGTVVNLVQAYHEHNNNEDPPTGLMNCILLNTADDIGNRGPDYSTGWGRVNANRAAKIIEAKEYTSGTISNGQNETVNFNVPANVAQLKLMVYWKDPAAAANSSIALINDLDINVSGPGGTEYPWVLSTNVNSASAVDAPATRGANTFDRRNNVEQVTIDNPTAGSYTVNINGFNVPDGPQEYFVVWNFVMDEIEVTYPYGGESINAGDKVFVQFDTHGSNGNFKIEYSTDGGQSWNTASSNVNGARRYYEWDVPNIATGQARVRVSRNGLVGESVENSTIVGVPSNLSIGNRCSDRFELTWNAVSGATGYEVFILGEKYMETVGATDETFMVIPADANDEDWVSVRALTSNNGKGQRAVAINKPTGTNSSNCGPLQLAAVANFSYEVNCFEVTFTNNSLNDPTSYSWEFGDGNSSTQESPVHTFAGEGTYSVTLTATNQYGDDESTQEIELMILGAPDAEGGEACINESVSLSASGSNDLIWYDAPTNGNEVGTGGVFNTPPLSETTTYYVANGGECSTGERTAVDAVINTGGTPAVDDVEICEGETATFEATGSEGYTWTDSPDNGNVVGSDPTFTSPPLTTTTSYYVEGVAEVTTETVGIDAPNSGGFYDDDNRGLLVNITEPVIWRTTVMNAQSAGDRTIVIKDSPEGSVLVSKTVNVPQGTNTIELDIEVPAGSSLYFGVSGSANLYRENEGVNYPYTSASGIVEIATSNANTPGGFYYFFYNNVFEVKGCASNIVEVQAIVNEKPSAPEITAVGSLLSVADNYSSYQWYYEGESIDGATSNEHEALSDGSYFVIVGSDKMCENNSDTVAVILSALQNLVDDNLAVYPLPASDVLILEWSSGTNADYQLISPLGQILRAGTVSEGLNHINTLGLESGLYVLQLLYNGETFVQSVVKQ